MIDFLTEFHFLHSNQDTDASEEDACPCKGFMGFNE